MYSEIEITVEYEDDQAIGYSWERALKPLAKVRLQIPSWVACMLNSDHTDWLILDREIEAGSTVGNLLNTLAKEYPNFDRVIYDPAKGEMADQVVIVLNNNLLQEPEAKTIQLKDGDDIMLLPVFDGG